MVRSAIKLLRKPLPLPPPSLRQIERARAICRHCPVLTTCLRYAMDTGQHGVWGATTDDERRAMQQQGRRNAARGVMSGAP
jgi:WhiB family redox-sensing transcriptional regulator